MKSRRMRWTGHITRMGERKWTYKILTGRPEGRRPRGKQRRKWEDNIKMDLQELGWGGHGLDWSGSIWGQLTGFCKCGNKPSVYIKRWEFLTSWGPVSFTRRTLLNGVSYSHMYIYIYIYIYKTPLSAQRNRKLKLMETFYRCWCTSCDFQPSYFVN